MLLHSTVFEKWKMLIFKDQHIRITKSVHQQTERLRSEWCVWAPGGCRGGRRSEKVAWRRRTRGLMKGRDPRAGWLTLRRDEEWEPGKGTRSTAHLFGFSKTVNRGWCVHSQSDITRQVHGRNPHSSVCTDAWGHTWDWQWGLIDQNKAKQNKTPHTSSRIMWRGFATASCIDLCWRGGDGVGKLLAEPLSQASSVCTRQFLWSLLAIKMSPFRTVSN